MSLRILSGSTWGRRRQRLSRSSWSGSSSRVGQGSASGRSVGVMSEVYCLFEGGITAIEFLCSELRYGVVSCQRG